MNLLERLVEARLDPATRRDLGLDHGLGVVVVTPRFAASRHVVGLVFGTRVADPRLVVKVPRRPGDNSGVRREAAVLRAVLAAAPSLRGSVPEVVGVWAEGGHEALVETALLGPALDSERVQADPEGAARAGARFAAQLPRTRAGGSGSGRVWLTEVLEPLLTRFERQVPHAALGTADLAARSRAALARLADADLPRVLQHGDLSHPNLFCAADGALRVVDWERADADGLPGLDLVFLLQYLAEARADAYTRPEQLAVFDAEFADPAGWGRRHLASHLADRGVDPDLAPELVLATWVRSGAALLDRLLPEGADAAGGRTWADEELATALRQDRDVTLWRHALDRWEAAGSGRLAGPARQLDPRTAPAAGPPG